MKKPTRKVNQPRLRSSFTLPGKYKIAIKRVFANASHDATLSTENLASKHRGQVRNYQILLQSNYLAQSRLWQYDHQMIRTSISNYVHGKAVDHGRRCVSTQIVRLRGDATNSSVLQSKKLFTTECDTLSRFPISRADRRSSR